MASIQRCVCAIIPIGSNGSHAAPVLYRWVMGSVLLLHAFLNATGWSGVSRRQARGEPSSKGTAMAPISGAFAPWSPSAPTGASDENLWATGKSMQEADGHRRRCHGPGKSPAGASRIATTMHRESSHDCGRSWHRTISADDELLQYPCADAVEKPFAAIHGKRMPSEGNIVIKIIVRCLVGQGGFTSLRLARPRFSRRIVLRTRIQAAVIGLGIGRRAIIIFLGPGA